MRSPKRRWLFRTFLFRHNTMLALPQSPLGAFALTSLALVSRNSATSVVPRSLTLFLHILTPQSPSIIMSQYLKLGQILGCNTPNRAIGTKCVPIAEGSGGQRWERSETILKLLEGKREINLHEVAEAAGLSKSDEADRKAIRRAFQALIDRDLLKTKGAARARVYLYSLTMQSTYFCATYW